MSKTDKITFWIIEIMIVAIACVLWDSPSHHHYCGTYLWEHPEIAEKLRDDKILRRLAIIGFGLMATISNIAALYAVRLRVFPELPLISKIFIRVLTFGVVFSITVGLLLLLQPVLDSFALKIIR